MTSSHAQDSRYDIAQTLFLIYVMTDSSIIRLQMTPRRTYGPQIVLKLVLLMVMRLAQLVRIAGRLQCQIR